MDVGAVIGLVLFLAFMTLGLVVTVRVVRAVKRGVERTGTQVRRTVQETTLKARSAQPGPVGEVARVRLELRSSIDSTREALEAGAQDDPGLKEAIGLLDRLHEHARQLDGELRILMEREPDRTRIAARLPEARERMRGIKESADSLRYAAQDRARDFDAEGLRSLREQIEIETGALRHRPADPLDAAGGSVPSDAALGGSERGASELGGSRGEGELDGPGARGSGVLGKGTGGSGRSGGAEPNAPIPFEKRRPRSAS